MYSLPPCYFTQSALPIYQTGRCSVYYTCDLSRVTDFARCRLFAQLGHTLGLAQVTDDIGHFWESTSLLTADRSYQLMIELYRSGVKLLCQRILPVDIVDTRIVYSYYFVLTITSSFA